MNETVRGPHVMGLLSFVEQQALTTFDNTHSEFLHFQ